MNDDKVVTPTWQQIESIHDPIAAAVVDGFNRFGAVGNQIFLFELNEGGQITKTLTLPQKLTDDFFSSEGNKERLAAMIGALLAPNTALRRAAKNDLDIAPTMVVCVAEACVSSLHEPDGLKRECILVTIYTSLGVIPVCHLVDQDSRICVQAAFPKESSNAYGVHGRLVVDPTEEPTSINGHRAKPRIH